MAGVGRASSGSLHSGVGAGSLSRPCSSGTLARGLISSDIVAAPLGGGGGGGGSVLAGAGSRKMF